jgi:hypothetical protein
MGVMINLLLDENPHLSTRISKAKPANPPKDCKKRPLLIPPNIEAL